MGNVAAPAQSRIAMSGAGKRYGTLQVFLNVELTVGER